MADIIPTFLTKKLRAEYGDEAERVLAGYVKKPVTLRANTLKSDGDAVYGKLSAITRCERVGWYPDAFVLPEAEESEIAQTELYRRGEIYLQSLSSMLPPLVLGAEAGEEILDMTAAPGGKTTQIAALTGGKANITACEKDKIRFGRLRFNLERQGAGRVNVLPADALRLDECLRFDKILLDAPCSGSGTLAMGEKTVISEKLVQNCAALQERLLRKALTLLKKGGTLVYSTCSVLREENEEIVLRAAKGMEILPLRIPDVPLLSERGGMITVCPTELFEGFFLAKIRRPL